MVKEWSPNAWLYISASCMVKLFLSYRVLLRHLLGTARRWDRAVVCRISLVRDGLLATKEKVKHIRVSSTSAEMDEVGSGDEGHCDNEMEPLVDATSSHLQAQMAVLTPYLRPHDIEQDIELSKQT